MGKEEPTKSVRMTLFKELEKLGLLPPGTRPEEAKEQKLLPVKLNEISEEAFNELLNVIMKLSTAEDTTEE